MQPRRPQWGGFLPRSDIPRYRSRGKDGETRQNRKKTQDGSEAMWGGGELSFMLCLWTLTPLTTQGLFSGPASMASAHNPPLPHRFSPMASSHSLSRNEAHSCLVGGAVWFLMLGCLSSSRYILCPSIMGTIIGWHYLLLLERKSALSSEFGRMDRKFSHVWILSLFFWEFPKTNWSSLRAKKCTGKGPHYWLKTRV